MPKEIIVNASLAEEIRIAILENGRLADLDIETQSRTKRKGSIYKGIVSNTEDSLDAAFIDFGEERQAFLPFSEIRPEIYAGDAELDRRVKISDALTPGQEIVIQVTKDEIGNKGAASSTYLSIPGRYVVLMHSSDRRNGISRKIAGESARKTAREALSRFQMPMGMGAIIRTAGVNATQEDLIRDFQHLCKEWERISSAAKLGRAPTLLYREPDITVRTIRDYFSPSVKSVVIDSEEDYEEARAYFNEHMPDLVKLLERYRRKEPIFQFYGIEQAIEKLHQREVKLPSGGYIVIEQTEALVAIDVNSGSATREVGHEATVYKTNLEATEEIARQLRLRDLGGIIVVDFIDMISVRHKRDVERRLASLMRADKARTKVGHISENGTLELTRQRLRQSYRLISHVACEHCNGTGRVRDAEGLTLNALRRISGHLARKRTQLTKLNVSVPTQVASVLNNHKRRELIQLCDTYNIDIEVLGDARLEGNSIELKEERRGQAGMAASSSHARPAWRKRPATTSGAGRTSPRGGKPAQNSLPETGIELGSAPCLAEVHSEQPPQAPEKQVFADALEEALFGFAIIPELINGHDQAQSIQADLETSTEPSQPQS